MGVLCRRFAVLWERQDRLDQALAHAQQALTLYQAASHHRGQASALNNVGWYHALLGDHTQALTYCQQALTLCQQTGDRDGEAGTWDSLGYALTRLGDTRHTTGNPQAARTAWTHALTILTDLDHPDADAVRAKLHDLDSSHQHDYAHQRSLRRDGSLKV